MSFASWLRTFGRSLGQRAASFPRRQSRPNPMRVAGARPFLEALESLLHADARELAARLMKLLAPTWYVQIAPLTDDGSSERLLAEARADGRGLGFPDGGGDLGPSADLAPFQASGACALAGPRA